MDEEVSYSHTPAGLLAQQLRALHACTPSATVDANGALAKSTLQSIYKLLTAYPEKFSSGSTAVQEQLNALQDALTCQMHVFENSVDMVKGLITLSNLVQRLKAASANALTPAANSTKSDVLALLCRFFVKVQNDEDALFQTLALLAHLAPKSTAEESLAAARHTASASVRKMSSEGESAAIANGSDDDEEEQECSSRKGANSLRRARKASHQMTESSEHDEQQSTTTGCFGNSVNGRKSNSDAHANDDAGSEMSFSLSGGRSGDGAAAAGSKAGGAQHRTWFSKQFVQRFIEYEFDSVTAANAAASAATTTSSNGTNSAGKSATQNGVLPLFAAVSVALVAHSAALAEMRVLNQFKTFLLQLLRECSQIDAPKALGQVVYSLSRIVADAKLNEKEVLKMRTIEVLIPLVARDRPRVVTFGAVRVLKTLWRANIRRSAMIKQDIVKRLIDVYGLQPQFVQGFADEILAAPEGSTLVQQHQSVLLALVRQTIAQNAALEQQSRAALLHLERRVTGATPANAQQLIALIGQGLMQYLHAHLQCAGHAPATSDACGTTPAPSARQCEFRLQHVVHDYFSLLLRAAQPTAPA